jgi:Zn-dependent M28 family amino/carboxypeptidase
MRIAALFFCGASLYAQDVLPSAERIREHTKFLSSDLLEGRGPGTRGGQLASEYIATQLALAGAKPAGENGTYFQRVPLVGIETQATATLNASAGGKTVDFKWADEFIGVSDLQRPEVRFEGEAVFVGHGISAPEFKRDDFRGIDVKDKILVLFTNEPPSTDPKFFDGRALTYYGRWTYKYEEALRHGARGVIIIHTTPTASYGWEVVRSSWGRENPYVKLGPNDKALSFAGWVSKDAGEKLLGLANHKVDELLAAADKPDFKPFALGIKIGGNIPSKIREMETRNVAAIIPGSDPKLKDEVVIYSAHWDHLGVGEAVKGDTIYNGAIDNATGCAILLEMARVWGSTPQKPKRSALFLAVTAEEGGLRGSEYYAAHPLLPPAKSSIALNYDGLSPWGRLKDMVLTGAERTTALPLAQQYAKRLELAIAPDPTPEAGHYFRSDHFSFAKVGIPAFSIGSGTEYAGKPAGWGKQKEEEYNDKHYHQPSDEFQADWDFTALQQLAQFGYLLGTDAANQAKLIDWRPGEQFKR